MSRYVHRTPLRDLCPRLWAEPAQLYARSSWLTQLLTLFAFCRFVHVDARLNVVLVELFRFRGFATPMRSRGWWA